MSIADNDGSGLVQLGHSIHNSFATLGLGALGIVLADDLGKPRELQNVICQLAFDFGY